MRQSTRVFAPRQTTSFATTAEALKAGGLDWNVELEPIKTASGFDAPAKAVVRTDTRKPLGVVGTRYRSAGARIPSWSRAPKLVAVKYKRRRGHS